MVYKEDVHIRLTNKQMNILSKLAELSGLSTSDVVRRSIEIVGSEDKIVVPLDTKERLFVERICETARVLPPDAMKMVLLSYHTVMSRELWRLIKPIDQILDETKEDNNDEENR